MSLSAASAERLGAGWLEEAARAIAGRGEPCPLAARAADGDAIWWLQAETPGGQATVGAAAARFVAAAGAACMVWTWLAVSGEWRGYGYGGASVPLLERAAGRMGAESALAPLPPDNGIALYFWLRLGYVPDASLRPPPAARPAGVADGALWMRREIGSGR